MKGPRLQHRKSDKSSDSDMNSLMTHLREIGSSKDAPPAARNAAIRTVLEVTGKLGRHASKPGTGAAIVSLSEATRTDLEKELSRLRAVNAAQDMAEMFGTSTP